jgi:hypothetical protein
MRWISSSNLGRQISSVLHGLGGSAEWQLFQITSDQHESFVTAFVTTPRKHAFQEIVLDNLITCLKLLKRHLAASSV